MRDSRRLSVTALAAFLTLSGLMPARSHAATINVPGDHAAIQAAINAAMSGDSILVGPGLYREILDTKGKTLCLVGVAGAEATVIDGGFLGTVVHIYPAGSISGFTIQSGHSVHDGGGVLIEGAGPTIVAANLIQNNIAGSYDVGYGGGVCVGHGANAVTVRDNTIVANYAGDQGGGVGVISAAMAVYITGNVIRGNSCHVSGGGASLGGSTFDHNLVVSNFSDHFGGGTVYGGTISYNTICNNGTGDNSLNGAGMQYPGMLTSHNIVLANHGPAGTNAGVGILMVDNDPEARFECNDAWNNRGGDYYIVGGPDTSGSGNISADPLFCQPESNDYRLAPQSPCSGSSGSCGLIGAFPVDVGCSPVITRKVSWGRLKAIYR